MLPQSLGLPPGLILCSKLTGGPIGIDACGWTKSHVAIVWQSWHWNEKRKVSEYYDALQAINAQKGASNASNPSWLLYVVNSCRWLPHVLHSTSHPS